MKHKINNSVEVLGYDKECPKCKQKLQIRKHKFLREKQQKAPYYYKKWYVCVNTNCCYQLNLEEDKHYNKNEMGMYHKAREGERDLLSLIRGF